MLQIVEELQTEIQTLDFGGLANLKEYKTEAQKKREKWEKSKLGYFSGSSISRLCGYETKKELPDGAFSYISEKVYERIFSEKYNEIFETEDILRGRNYESVAIAELEKETKISFSFINEDQKFFKKHGFGATPDGVSRQYTVEIKCPRFVNHNAFKRMTKGEDLKKVSKEYWYQVQSQMLVTGKKKSIFCSYYINEKTGFTDLFWIIIDQCEKTQAFILERVKMALEEFEKQLKTYA